MASSRQKVYADTHYNTEANIKDLSLMGIDLRGPVVTMPEQDRTKEENISFEVDLEHQSVTCSEGKTSIRFSPRAQNKISATFSQKDCRPCKDAGRCKPAPRGKNILIKLESPILSGRRIEMQTDAFKREMHQRNGIEGTLSGLVAKGNNYETVAILVKRRQDLRPNLPRRRQISNVCIDFMRFCGPHSGERG